MTPSLTRTGLLSVAVGAAFVVAGVVLGAWPLLAIGFVQISALLVLYVLFVTPAAMLRRHNLELAWWVPAAQTAGGALVVDRPLELHVLLRNRTPFALTMSRMELVASRALELEPGPVAALLPARQEVQLRLQVTPRAAGHWFFQGAMVQLRDRVGVFGLQLYYPNLMGIKVFPYLGAGREPIPFRPRTGASHERAGPRLLRQRGLGSDLREIRDHIPGDPFKRIAWKATARTRKLMVREYESEIMVTHWLLLDISSTMRSQRPGRSKLDYGLSLCAAFARVALESGDRVGLITFDHRIYSQVAPADGQPQLYRIVERLMELHNVVDEDLTDLTDAELYGAVAQYLAYQEGISVTLHGRPPGPEVARRAGLVEGPRGQWYDAEVMGRQVAQLMERRRTAGSSRWWSKIIAGDAHTARLRLFCRLHGLEIPYRQHSPLISKERGMADAIRRAGAKRQSQFVVLVSDLEDVGDGRTVIDALRLSRRRGHTVVAVAPFAPAFFASRQDPHARRVQNIFALQVRRRRAEVVRRMEGAGISVLSAAPGDVLPLLLRRLARLRSVRSGLAV
jgi:uncharacterized protein (DUF58 family)